MIGLAVATRLWLHSARRGHSSAVTGWWVGAEDARGDVSHVDAPLGYVPSVTPLSGPFAPGPVRSLRRHYGMVPRATAWVLSSRGFLLPGGAPLHTQTTQELFPAESNRQSAVDLATGTYRPLS